MITLGGEGEAHIAILPQDSEFFELTVLDTRIFDSTLPSGSQGGTILPNLTRADLLKLRDYISEQIAAVQPTLPGL